MPPGMRIALLIIALLSSTDRMTAQGLLAPGISAELAQRRGQRISNVFYTLEFELHRNMRLVTGRIHGRFTLVDENQPQSPVILDFAGSSLDQLRVNEVTQDRFRVIENHIVLPAEALNPLENSFEVEFTSEVASTGTPLTVYKDPIDGQEYYYTLLVPADAHRLFPCFDQPDLKAMVSLSLIVPPNWKVIGNTDVDDDQSDSTGAGTYQYRFEETQPLSTYLVAFAAGPFTVLDKPFVGGIGDDPRRPMRVYHRKSRTSDLDASVIMTRHREALTWLQSYFGIPYPFSKLDVVLLPGFPYGGMEHAGAIFYRESSLIFDHDPTDSEETSRSTLIYHELSHQWFGNLVTMEWFDDLWLKEGFATFLAYTCLAALEPDRNAWLRFDQRVKPSAYDIDRTPGTTPVYQELGNLNDAKSAYGAIVYNKAPAVLHELRERLGERVFRSGLRSFLARYAYENARWEDLVAALNRSRGTDLRAWSNRWILSAGMPSVRAEWEADGEGISQFVIHQQSSGETRVTWPLRLEILLIGESGERQTIVVQTSRETANIERLVGRPTPACVLLNPNGIAYGRFLLDETSQAYLLENLAQEDDPLVRSVALASLYETVHDGDLDPRRLVDLIIDMLEDERDAETQQQLFGILSTCLFRYLPPERRPLEALTAQLLAGLEDGEPGLSLQTFRFLARFGEGEGVLELCRRVASAQASGFGVTPGKQDRFLAAAALLARGEGSEILTRLERELARADVGKEVYSSGAAEPTAEAKARYFDSYLQQSEPPELWMQSSLPFFHWPGQQALTLPYLQQALEQVDWVKTHRRIFFMPAWIDAFINGQNSEDALQIVERFLETEPLTEDVRRKLLQSVDGLRRTVMIRQRWG